MTTLVLEEAIVSRLEQLTVLTGIASAIRVDELFPRDDYPAVIVTLVESTPWQEIGGQFNGKVRNRIEVSCWGKTRGVTRRMELAARHGRLDDLGASDGLLDWKGTIDGKAIDNVTWQGLRTAVQEPTEGEPFFLFSTIGMYDVLWDEPVRV